MNCMVLTNCCLLCVGDIFDASSLKESSQPYNFCKIMEFVFGSCTGVLVKEDITRIQVCTSAIMIFGCAFIYAISLTEFVFFSQLTNVNPLLCASLYMVLLWQQPLQYYILSFLV